MKIRNLFFILVVIGAGILFFTNPEEKVHREFLKTKIIALSDKKIEEELNKKGRAEDKGLKFLAQNLGSILTDKISDRLIDARMKRVNYYLFSISQVQYEGEWYPVAIGIANHMYFFPKVEKKLDELDSADVYKLFK